MLRNDTFVRFLESEASAELALMPGVAPDADEVDELVSAQSPSPSPSDAGDMVRSL